MARKPLSHRTFPERRGAAWSRTSAPAARAGAPAKPSARL